MTDPSRLSDDESISEETRRLIDTAPSPGGLPPEVHARARAHIQRKLRYRRRLRIGAGVSLGGLALAAAFLALLRTPEVLPEQISNQAALAPSASDSNSSESGARRKPRCPECLLIPKSTGWLDRRDNLWGAQGAFYVDASAGSTVLAPAPPSEGARDGWRWRNDGEGRLCLKGSAAAVRDGDFTTRWGVVAGVELCDTGPDAQPPDRTFSIEDCPFGKLAALRGIRFDLEGSDIPSDLRVVFSEIGSNENAFVPLYDADAGPHEIRIDEARVSYQQPPRRARRDRVRGVEWLIPSRMSQPAQFDFCVADIELF